jgi:DUF1365 family protein
MYKRIKMPDRNLFIGLEYWDDDYCIVATLEGDAEPIAAFPMSHALHDVVDESFSHDAKIATLERMIHLKGILEEVIERIDDKLHEQILDNSSKGYEELN